MTEPQLHWREAQREDRQRLQNFCCAPERMKDRRGRPLPHPKPWTREVELGLRVQRTPVRDGFMLLGENAYGRLCAVVLMYDDGRDGDQYNLKLAALAVALADQGQGYGVEALQMALRAAEDRAYGSGCLSVDVWGFVDRRNEASQILCEKAGMVRLPSQPDDQYEEWWISLELPPDAP